MNVTIKSPDATSLIGKWTQAAPRVSPLGNMDSGAYPRSTRLVRSCVTGAVALALLQPTSSEAWWWLPFVEGVGARAAASAAIEATATRAATVAAARAATQAAAARAAAAEATVARKQLQAATAQSATLQRRSISDRVQDGAAVIGVVQALGARKAEAAVPAPALIRIEQRVTNLAPRDGGQAQVQAVLISQGVIVGRIWLDAIPLNVEHFQFVNSIDASELPPFDSIVLLARDPETNTFLPEIVFQS